MPDVIKKCEGSNTTQMVDWEPSGSDAFDGKPYPGASVCIHCSHGVLLVRGSIRKATSMTGVKGTAGTLRVHYLKDDLMAYTKGGLK